MNDNDDSFEEDKTLPWHLWGKRTVMFFFYDVWFRVAAAVFIILVIFLSLFLPKIWQSSPPDFVPVIKVSGLDKVQAWQLRRAALKFDREGQFSDAMYSWRSAILNEPCDPELHRGVLRTLIGQKVPDRDYLAYGARDTFWLLRLTRTNLADLELVAEWYEKYQLNELTVAMLETHISQLTPTMARRLLKACYHRGEMERFGEVLAKFPTGATDDAELKTYVAAWRAGWGNPGERPEGRRALEAALTQPAQRQLAHRLRLGLAAQQGDLPTFEKSLEYLRDDHADTVIDHVNYWNLLASNDRKAEAVREARGFANPPSTPGEAMAMGRAFNALGLEEYAVQFIDKYLPTFSWHAPLWALQASFLAQQKRWDELRALAVNLRSDETTRNQLGGFSYYLEGLSHANLRRNDLAKEAFAKVPTLPFDSPARAYQVATALNRLGHSQPAAELLRKTEGSFTNRAEFYHQMVVAGFQSRQTEGLLEAAQKAYDLQPSNPDLASNLSAALIALRQQPARALQLTVQLLTLNQENGGVLINHAMALTQNLRLEEAEAALRRVNLSVLTPEAISAYHFAWFEIHARQGRAVEARRSLDGVKQSLLLPEQVAWIQETLAKLPPAKP